MRLLFIGSVVVWIGLTVSSAAAYRAHANMIDRYHYSSCYCHFGYPERVCLPVVSCDAEGGRCRGGCPPIRIND